LDTQITAVASSKTAGRKSPVDYVRDFAVQPDFVVLGKAIGNGAPLSVLMGDRSHLEVYGNARSGGTHSNGLKDSQFLLGWA
jgi:glutamate-1-semialdehyde 2,1-aminomutase